LRVASCFSGRATGLSLISVRGERFETCFDFAVQVRKSPFSEDLLGIAGEDDKIIVFPVFPDFLTPM